MCFCIIHMAWLVENIVNKISFSWALFIFGSQLVGKDTVAAFNKWQRQRQLNSWPWWGKWNSVLSPSAVQTGELQRRPGKRWMYSPAVPTTLHLVAASPKGAMWSTFKINSTKKRRVLHNKGNCCERRRAMRSGTRTIVKQVRFHFPSVFVNLVSIITDTVYGWTVRFEVKMTFTAANLDCIEDCRRALFKS